MQNVGAYGQEVASVIERVRAFDLQEHEFVEFAAAECGFAYRRSRFNSADRGRYIVTRVDYRLTPGGAPTLRYAELQRAFPEGAQPSLAEVAAQVRRIRQAKGMLIVEGDPDCRSAGSFFKNPVVTDEQFRQIAAASEKAPPRFPAGPERRESGPGQGSGSLADRAGRLRQRVRAGRCRHLLAAHAGARQSWRSQRSGDFGARRPDHRCRRGALWHSPGDGAGDGGVLILERPCRLADLLALFTEYSRNYLRYTVSINQESASHGDILLYLNSGKPVAQVASQQIMQTISRK